MLPVPIQKWEYKYEKLTGQFNAYFKGRRSPGEDKLDELGAQGWELVSVTQDSGYSLFFKRPKQ
jgi:hypothetical protein